MKGKMDTIGVLLLVGAALVVLGVWQPFAATGVDGVDGTAEAQGCGFATATLTGDSYDPYAGTNATVNFVGFNGDGEEKIAETLVYGLTTISTAAPTSFDGYFYVGNDNQVGTDRGADYYYTKTDTESWTCDGQPKIPRVTVYAEGTPTWTGKDKGSVEATTNITVGTTINYDLSLVIQASANQCLGNKDFAHPLAVCTNVTGTGTGSSTGHWDKIAPTDTYVANGEGNNGEISVPEFLNGYDVVGGCYVLDTPALCNGEEFEFKMQLDPSGSNNPAVTAGLRVFLLDQSYYRDDLNMMQTGWEDRSTIASDADIAMDAITNTKQVALG